MGTLHVSHPQIHEFIRAKVENRELSYFNISIEVTDEFMESAATRQGFLLADGSSVNAYDLLHEIATATWACGDPGLINLDRMNAHNPLVAISAYDCAPPCGEMGLAPGETCQFGYLNLANYVNYDGTIQVERLKDSVRTLVRVLDNAVEYGLDHQPTIEGKNLARMKRKIGVSVTGLADALIKARLEYDEAEGRQLARDLISLINYQAKVVSVELAVQRGPCEGMKFSQNQYFHGYVADRFASQPTNTVSQQDWQELDEYIRQTGLLRNIHHTALPPSGRASMILGVNHSIEPIFSPTNLSVDSIKHVIDLIASSISNQQEEAQKVFNQAVIEGTFQNLPLTNKAKQVLKTAIEIQPSHHIQMAAALAGENGVTDESASKTVNLHQDATPDDIVEIFLQAHQMGLFNISVYRDHSLVYQPRSLS